MGKKNRFVYYVLDEKNNIVFSGLSPKVAEFLVISPKYVYIAWKNKTVVLGKYRLEREEKFPYIKTDPLETMCRMYFYKTNECPKDECNFKCNINCNKTKDAISCWKKWAKNFTKENHESEERGKND